MKHHGWIGVALAAALAMGVPATAAAEEQDVAVLRAGALARGGRCDEALALLAQSGAASARAVLLRGQCHVEGKRWVEAVAALDEALRLDPKLDEAKLPLVMARYHVGDLAGARQALDSLPANATQQPEYHLYRGLLLLEAAQSAEAGAAFDRARELAPTEVEPIAAYYSGVAWLSAKDRARADAAFDRVIALAPGSVWAQEAERARKGGAGAAGPLARWAWVRAGAEWDSNVVLRGDDVSLPSEIGDESDGRAVWVLHGGAELFRRGSWSGGINGTYYGSAHFDLTDFDENHPTAGLWLDHRFDEATVLRVRYDAGHAWIDGDEFLFDQELAPTLYHDWGRAGQTQLGARFSKLSFLYPVTAPALGGFASDYRNRDGWGWGVNAQHGIAVGGPETELFVGAGYFDYDARGGEYSYAGPNVWVGVETLLPAAFQLRATGGFAYLSFDNPSSFPDPTTGLLDPAHRRDHTWHARIELERELGAGFSALARYSYQDRDTHTDVFDYDRHIVGLYVTYQLAP